MKTTDFQNIDELWEWVRNRTLNEFRFLIEELGFENVKNEITPTQCSVEYRKENVLIGIWSSYGTRPEVFIKTNGRRVFTDQLIAKYARGLKLPVSPSVFGEQVIKDNYRSMLKAYAGLVRTCITLPKTDN